MTRELVFVVQGDITVVESGARRRFREAFDFLLLHFENITLYSYFEDGNRPWDQSAIARFAEEFPQVRLVLDHRKLPHRLFARFKQALIVAFPRFTHDIIKLMMPGLNPNFQALKKNLRNPFFFMCGVDNVLELNGVPDGPIVVDTLDVKFVHAAIINNVPSYDMRMLARMRVEFSLLSRCDAMVAISRSETVLLSVLSSGQECFFVPSFQDEPKASPRLQKDSYDSDLLFVGTAYHFNLVGLMSFLTENREWLSPLRITVAGKVSLAPEVIALAKDWPGLKLMGFVDDLAPLYARTKLAISPVEGTGLKIKILEALRYGTPVAASKSSFDGLPDGYQNCVFPIGRTSIERLLTDPAARKAAEQAADAYMLGGVFTEPRDDLLRYLQEKMRL